MEMVSDLIWTNNFMKENEAKIDMEYLRMKEIADQQALQERYNKAQEMLSMKAGVQHQL